MREMSINDVLTLVGILVTMFFSVIAVWQSYSANEKAKEANGIAKKTKEISQNSFREQEKGSMPLIRFVGGIKAVEKSLEDLLSSVTFDLESLIKDFDTREYPCIEVELENVGGGVITGGKITKFIVFKGNQGILDRMDEDDDPLDLLCFLEEEGIKNGVFTFLLPSGERTKVNFVFNKTIDEMEEIVNGYVSIFMDLEVTSTNDTGSKQRFMYASFGDNKLIYNSVPDVSSSNQLEEAEKKKNR